MGFINLFLVPIFEILGFVVNIYFKIVFLAVALDLLIRIKVITVHTQSAEKFMKFLKAVTEPVYAILRKKVPPVGGYDVVPYALVLAVAFIALFIERITINLSAVQ